MTATLPPTGYDVACRIRRAIRSGFGPALLWIEPADDLEPGAVVVYPYPDAYGADDAPAVIYVVTYHGAIASRLCDRPLFTGALADYRARAWSSILPAIRRAQAGFR